MPYWKTLAPKDRILQTATPGLFARTVTADHAKPWNFANHLKVVDRLLVLAARGDERYRRLIINLPFRGGKSRLISEMFPAWFLGTFPHKNVIVSGADFKLTSGFTRSSRNLLEEYGPGIFGTHVDQESRAAHEWFTTEGGACRAFGVGGSIQGRGGDVSIVDDYYGHLKDALSETERENVRRWYTSDLSSRLTPDGVIIIVASRWDSQDLVGWLLKNEPGEWHHHVVPAILPNGESYWPEQWPVEKLLKKKASYERLGYPWMWDSNYMGDPPEVIDAEFDASYFGEWQWVNRWPDCALEGIRGMSLDPSLGKTEKSDYSAFVKGAAGTDGLYYIEADLARRDAVRILDDGVSHYMGWIPEFFVIEGNQFQGALESLYHKWTQDQRITMPIQLIHSKTDKQMRIRMTVTPFLSQKQLRFIDTPGTRMLVDQLKGFPTLKYKDGPDALEMLLKMFNRIHAGQEIGADVDASEEAWT